MIEVKIQVDDTKAAATVQRVRNALANRTALHARMADQGAQLTRSWVARLDRHQTAQRLGAAPTGHLAKASKLISGVSDAEGGAIRVPRASRLRAAFGGYVVRPGSGKKYLTIPASPRTYGRRVGEIQEPLHFQMVGRGKALCFSDGTVAYWLRTSVNISEDRTLLPFDQLPKLFSRVATGYVAEIEAGGKGGLA